MRVWWVSSAGRWDWRWRSRCQWARLSRGGPFGKAEEGLMAFSVEIMDASFEGPEGLCGASEVLRMEAI